MSNDLEIILLSDGRALLVRYNEDEGDYVLLGCYPDHATALEAMRIARELLK